MTPARPAVATAADDDRALAAGLAAVCGAEVAVERDAAGTPVATVPAAAWHAAALHVRDTLGLDFFDWLSAVDEPDGDPAGVDVMVHVADTRSAGPAPAAGTGRVRRLMLRTRVPDTASELASLTTVWPGAAWHERETAEMFGVAFSGFVDAAGLGLRPLLLPEGFEGTPLRKSFVLAARVAKPWPGAKEPGEGRESGEGGGRAPGRRRTLPPGVPDPSWGPREPGGGEVAP